jgi:hypothetical protein
MDGIIEFLFLQFPLIRIVLLGFCPVLLLLLLFLTFRPPGGVAGSYWVVWVDCEVLRRSFILFDNDPSPSLGGQLFESADLILDIEDVLDRRVHLVWEHIVRFHEVDHLQDFPFHVRPLRRGGLRAPMHEAWPSELIRFQPELLLCELAFAFAIARGAAIPRVLSLIVVLTIIIHVSTEAAHYFCD